MRKQAAMRQADILEVLNGATAPLTAYQILEELQDGEPQIAAPTVYRALNALTEQGKAHRLETLKAFVPCRCSHDTGVQILAICHQCGSVEEHDGSAVLPLLDAITAPSKFSAQKHTLEIQGQCAACSKDEPNQ